MPAPVPAKATPPAPATPRLTGVLGREIDASDRVDRQRAMRALLVQPLLAANGPQAEHYALVRRHATWLIEWFARHPRWPLVVTPELARLRKLPAETSDSTRPAIDFKTQQPFNCRRYALLCLALAVLERADRQITLARLAENILAAAQAPPGWSAAGWPLELGHADGRRDLVHIVRRLIDWQVLRRLDGDEENLLRNAEANALYTIHRTLLTNLLAGRNPSFVSGTSVTERLAGLADSGPAETDEARNELIRTRLYRRLLDDPVLYYDTLSAEERFYCDRQRPTLLARLVEATGLEPEIRAEGIALVDPTGESTDVRLPEQGTYGHATLLIATHLAGLLREQPRDGAGPRLRVPRSTLERMIIGYAQQYRGYWKGETLVTGAEIELCTRVLDRLSALGLVSLAPDGDVEPRPALGRFALVPPTPLATAPLSDDFAPPAPTAPTTSPELDLS